MNHIERVLEVFAFPFPSAITTTIGTAVTVLDAANHFMTAAFSPVTFAVTAAVGAVFAAIVYSQMNMDRLIAKVQGDGRSVKNFLLSASSLSLGIMPGLISRTFSVLLFCSSGVVGFRTGFLCMQTVLQGREVYPLLKLQAEPNVEN